LKTEGLKARFKLQWKNYLWQTAAATFVLFLALRFLQQRDIVIISSIAATAFIVFCTPNSPFARPRNVIGGHSLGLLAGTLAFLVPQLGQGPIRLSLAVGLNILLMLVTATVHPPACGTALGIAITGPSIEAVVAVLVSSTALSLGRFSLRKYLKNLL
jgi:CBS-domain-containing membrane protein